MSLTLSVEIDSPAAVTMVLDNMDGASDPDAKLDDNALVRIIFPIRIKSLKVFFTHTVTYGDTHRQSHK